MRYDAAIVTNRRAGRVSLPAAAVLALVVAACRTPDAAPAVAVVQFSTSKARVSPGSPVDFTYEFDVAPGAAISGDYRVFTQIVDADGDGVPWEDDHAPAVPTSQWKPGETVKYTRTTFVPMTAPLGDVSVEVGLYNGDDRLPLTTDPAPAKPPHGRAYRVGTLQIVPLAEGNLFLIRRSGWYPSEGAWSWTQKTAVFGLETNPHRDLLLYLHYAGMPAMLGGQPQQVTVSAGRQVLDRFTVNSTDPAIRRIPVPASALGAADPPEQFSLEVDRTFVPASQPGGSQDTRTLGLRVFHYFVEAR